MWRDFPKSVAELHIVALRVGKRGHENPPLMCQLVRYLGKAAFVATRSQMWYKFESSCFCSLVLKCNTEARI
jgi:hypothetical protein